MFKGTHKLVHCENTQNYKLENYLCCENLNSDYIEMKGYRLVLIVFKYNNVHSTQPFLYFLREVLKHC